MEAWTIKQTQVFFRNPALNIPRSTIQTWMQHGIFTPCETVAYRDPRGCRLDFSDLVTLALLRVFIAVGVGYKSLGYQDITFWTDGLDREDETDLLKAEAAGRAIQKYLSMTDYRVHAVVRPELLWHRHHIYFQPTATLDQGNLARLRDQHTWQPIILIKVRPLYDYLRAVVDGPPRQEDKGEGVS
jgi:hypothetical protein